jgi:hypothetical protein
VLGRIVDKHVTPTKMQCVVCLESGFMVGPDLAAGPTSASESLYT